MSKQVPKMILSESYFYEDEILPDFQARQKVALKQKESLPSDLPNTIGMRSINPKSNIKKYLVECVSSSSIHGFNHLVAPSRHPVERFLMALIIAVCLLCLIFLSHLFWLRYQDDSVAIVLNKDLSKFAALKLSLYICPLDNIVPSKMPEVFKKYNIEHTPEAEKFFIFLSNVTYDNILVTPIYDEVPADNWTDILYDLKKDISPNVLNTNDSEAWVWTERGLCFVTRSLMGKFFTVENRMKQKMRREIYNIRKLPLYRFGAKSITEQFFVEHTSKISAMDPFEFLIYDTPTKLIRSKRLQSAIVQTYRVGMITGFRKVNIRQRGCKLYTDGGLPSTPTYSENVCYWECRMQVILRHCNCRPHFAKPIEGHKTCNAKQLRCIGGIIKKLFLYDFAPSKCNCLEKCNLHTFDIKITTNTELDNEPISSSVMTFTIKGPQVIYSREITYDLFDFLASIGGAAGLFLGASLLSFVELFYFVTLRLYFRVKEFIAKRRKLDLLKQSIGQK